MSISSNLLVGHKNTHDLFNKAINIDIQKNPSEIDCVLFMINTYISTELEMTNLQENLNFINLLLNINNKIFHSGSQLFYCMLSKSLQILYSKIQNLNSIQELKQDLETIFIDLQKLYHLNINYLTKSINDLKTIICEINKKQTYENSKNNILGSNITSSYNQFYHSNSNHNEYLLNKKDNYGPWFDQLLGKLETHVEQNREIVKNILLESNFKLFLKQFFQNYTLKFIGSMKHGLLNFNGDNFYVDILLIRDHDLEKITSLSLIYAILSQNLGNNISLTPYYNTKNNVEANLYCNLNYKNNMISINLIFYNKIYGMSHKILKKFYKKYKLFWKLHLFYQHILLTAIPLLKNRYHLTVLILNFLENSFKIFQKNDIIEKISYFIRDSNNDDEMIKISSEIFYYNFNDQTLNSIQANKTISMLISNFSDFLLDYFTWIEAKYYNQKRGFIVNASLKNQFENDFFSKDLFILTRKFIDNCFWEKSEEEFQTFFGKNFANYQKFHYKIKNISREVQSYQELCTF